VGESKGAGKHDGATEKAVQGFSFSLKSVGHENGSACKISCENVQSNTVPTNPSRHCFSLGIGCDRVAVRMKLLFR
jgi:hypothetical protein